MVNIAMARVMVSFVERTGAEFRPEDEAAMGEAQPGGLWHWLQGLAARQRVALLGGLTALRAEVRPRA